MPRISGNLALDEKRLVERDDVHCRARAFGPDAGALMLLIVNISPLGLMARVDTRYGKGDRLRITLPVVGVMAAEIRWSLGGRIGCEFDTPIDLASYYETLAAILSKA